VLAFLCDLNFAYANIDCWMGLCFVLVIVAERHECHGSKHILTYK